MRHYFIGALVGLVAPLPVVAQPRAVVPDDVGCRCLWIGTGQIVPAPEVNHLTDKLADEWALRECFAGVGLDILELSGGGFEG